MIESSLVRLSRRELTILISALLNSDEFIADEDYETVMGNSRSDAWALMERLVTERDQASPR